MRFRGCLLPEQLLSQNLLAFFCLACSVRRSYLISLYISYMRRISLPAYERKPRNSGPRHFWDDFLNNIHIIQIAFIDFLKIGYAATFWARFNIEPSNFYGENFVCYVLQKTLHVLLNDYLIFKYIYRLRH